MDPKPVPSARTLSGELPLHLPLRRVLCAVRSLKAAPEALRRARSMATALSAELRLLHVMTEPLFYSPLYPQLSAEASSSRIERCAALLEETRRVCAGTGALGQEDVLLRSGDFIDVVTEVAGEMDPDLIVLADEEGLRGRQATRIARDTQTPVLIARPPRPGDVIVAATDLMDSRYPIIRGAALIGQNLASRLLLVHSVPPANATAALPEPWLPVFLEDAPDLSQIFHRLRSIADRYSPEAGAIVACHSDPADAILTAARARDADLVVVGTHKRSWLDRLLHGSVASRVVEHAPGSVLVLPLDVTERALTPLPAFSEAVPA
jgi:nucleotide-binding universal stress UspA family protein